jgi:hypothetical protein
MGVQAFARMMKIFRHISSVTKETCHTYPDTDLVLPGDVAYGVNTQFETRGRQALRIAHLLSNILQVGFSLSINAISSTHPPTHI